MRLTRKEGTEHYIKDRRSRHMRQIKTHKIKHTRQRPTDRRERRDETIWRRWTEAINL